MPTITEAEAQQLANIMRCWIAVDAGTDFAYAYTKQPHTREHSLQWMPSGGAGDANLLPIRIASDRPWTEQIWGPEPSTPPAPSENV